MTIIEKLIAEITEYLSNVKAGQSDPVIAKSVILLEQLYKILTKGKDFELKLFTQNDKNVIVKRDEEAHPRDEHGRFAGGGSFGGASSDSNSSGAAEASNFGGADVAAFTAAVQAAKDSRPAEDAWRVTAMSEEEFSTEHADAICHITSGGSVVAVTKDGDIVSVCKMVGDRTVRGAELLKMAVEAGGTKLDSYEGNHAFYVSHGFEPVSWCKWDSNYAPSGWKDGRDAPEDIIFYKYTGKVSGYASPEDFKSAVSASVDYGTAQKIRDESIE